MKKRLISFLLCIAFASVTSIKCFAYESIEDYRTYLDEKVVSALGEDTIEDLNNNGFEYSDLAEMPIDKLIDYVFCSIKDQMSFPLVILAKVTAVLIINALVESLTVKGELSTIFERIGVLGCSIIVFDGVLKSFDSICGYLWNIQDIMRAYIPIYATVTAASGAFRAGGSYYAGTLAVCELITFASESVILPFLRVFLALSFMAAINPEMRFSETAGSIKSGIKLVLTALMTLFTGLNAVKCFSSASIDSAASRAVRFSASSFVPIIGSSVSEAYSAVYSGIGVLKAEIGNIGIAAVLFLLIKPMLQLLAMRIVLCILKIIADLTGSRSSSELLGSTGYAVSAAISTVLCFSMMFVISTAALIISSNI